MIISDFHVLRPAFELDQEDSLKWLAAIHAEASKNPERYDAFLAVLRKIGLGEQKIQKRGVSINDCFHRDWNSMEIYHASTKPEGAGFGQRAKSSTGLPPMCWRGFILRTLLSPLI